MPVGMVSLRDLMGGGRIEAVSERMAGPVEAIATSATIEEAGLHLAERGLHRLVVVDAEGRACGVVSALDVLRAMLCQPTRRYSSNFPHLDKATGLVWTNELPFDAAHVAGAPRGAGIFVVSYGHYGVPDVPIWVDEAASIRERLLAMVQHPAAQEELARWFVDRRDELRFRAAVVEDADRRAEALEAVRAGMRAGAYAQQLAGI
jgi:CBS domain-containing protein